MAESERSFDSFIIQVRGEDDDSKNSTFYGQWKGIPQIGELIDCGKYRGAAIVDKGFHTSNKMSLSYLKKFDEFAGRPIRFSTLSFTWKAPTRNVGRLEILASVADGNFYQTISSERIRFETFPVFAHSSNLHQVHKKTNF